MLKWILFPLVLIIAFSSVEAQDQFKSSTYLGISGGGNLCRVSFTPSVDQNPLATPSVGLVFRHVSEPHIGLQVEATYLGRGWIENLDTLGTYKRSIQSIHLPLYAVFIAGSKTVRFTFTLGPYLSRVIKEEETIAVTDSRYLKDYYGKSLSDKWEFGFTGGIGVELHTRAGAFGLRALYNHSLTNIFPLNEDEFYYNTSRSQVLHVGLTYFIKI